VNDSSWRSLSAILGVACVILIFAAGALLATNGGGSTASPAGGSGVLVATDSGSPGSPPPTDSSANPGTPRPSGTPVPKAPIAQITFSNMMLDSSSDAKATIRTFTFVTDGVGPIGISIIKTTGATVKICARVDDSSFDCRYGGKITFTGALTDTSHSVWQVTLQGRNDTTPTVDLALSWPTFHPSITLTHGRLQGSTSPGVAEALNGFTATLKTREDGNVGLSASWTQIKADASVSLANVSAQTAQTVDEKHYTSVSDLGLPGYSYQVSAAQFYKISLRDLSPDGNRPDLRAVITFP
jgi:hypothetical protein